MPAPAPAEISAADVRRVRLRSQLLTGGGAGSPAEVAAWFGAMQAQDLQSGLWSFGVRLPTLIRADIEGSVARGEVLRTWPMRGTIHFVPAPDALWMLRTAGARALRTASARWRGLGLDLAVAQRAVAVFEAALVGGGRLPRSQLLAELAGAGIDPGGQRGYHLLWYASQIGVTCIGPQQAGEQTFALLREWAGPQRELAGEEALAELAARYFRSHGPTTRQDFMGWAGITAAQARSGIVEAGDRLVRVESAGADMYAAGECLDARPPGPVVRLLPGYDEFVLGYKDRSSFIPAGGMDAIVPGGNGVFRPTLLVDGTVAGTWSRTLTSRGVRVQVVPFEPLPEPVAEQVAQASAGYARFLGAALQQ